MKLFFLVLMYAGNGATTIPEPFYTMDACLIEGQKFHDASKPFYTQWYHCVTVDQSKKEE